MANYLLYCIYINHPHSVLLDLLYSLKSIYIFYNQYNNIKLKYMRYGKERADRSIYRHIMDASRLNSIQVCHVTSLHSLRITESSKSPNPALSRIQCSVYISLKNIVLKQDVLNVDQKILTDNSYRFFM